jgi:hypothetical protein
MSSLAGKSCLHVSFFWQSLLSPHFHRKYFNSNLYTFFFISSAQHYSKPGIVKTETRHHMCYIVDRNIT